MTSPLPGLRVAAVALICVAAATATAGATTAPQDIVKARVVLSDRAVTVSVHRVRRGSLVIFTIRNSSARARDFRIAQVRSGLIAPGRSARVELDFLDRATWRYSSTSPRARTLAGRFSVF